jgi:anti-sigma B factor antagonist
MQTARLELNKQDGSNGSVVARLGGKLSLETVNEFITTMRPDPAPHLVLDMSGLSFLDSAGVGALVSLFVSRRNHGKTMALAGLTQQGVAVMQVSGLMKLIPIFPSVNDALAKQA